MRNQEVNSSATVRVPGTVDKDLDELEALANGELDYDTHDTEEFFEHPRVGARLNTPNGSAIQVTRVLMPQVSECEMWVMAEGIVLSAPQCPERVKDRVTCLVNMSGAICIYEEI